MKKPNAPLPDANGALEVEPNAHKLLQEHERKEKKGGHKRRCRQAEAHVAKKKTKKHGDMPGGGAGGMLGVNLKVAPHISLGTTCCVVALRHGALVVVDSRISLVNKSDPRLCVFLDDRGKKSEYFPGDVVLATSGSVARSDQLRNYLRLQCCWGVDQVISKTEDFLKDNKVFNVLSEIGVLIVGHKKETNSYVSYICGDDLHGYTTNMTGSTNECIGAGQLGAKKILRKLRPKEEMTLEEGLHYLTKTMLGATFDHMGTGGDYYFWHVLENNTRPLGHVHTIDAIIKLRYLPMKSTKGNSLIILSKAANHGLVNQLELFLHFYNNSYELKNEIVLLGSIDEAWMLFLVNMDKTQDENKCLIKDPAKHYLKRCNTIGNMAKSFCRESCLVVNKRTKSIIGFLVVPFTYENLEVVSDPNFVRKFNNFKFEGSKNLIY